MNLHCLVFAVKTSYHNGLYRRGFFWARMFRQMFLMLLSQNNTVVLLMIGLGIDFSMKFSWCFCVYFYGFFQDSMCSCLLLEYCAMSMIAFVFF